VKSSRALWLVEGFFLGAAVVAQTQAAYEVPGMRRVRGRKGPRNSNNWRSLGCDLLIKCRVTARVPLYTEDLIKLCDCTSHETGDPESYGKENERRRDGHLNDGMVSRISTTWNMVGRSEGTWAQQRTTTFHNSSGISVG